MTQTFSHSSAPSDPWLELTTRLTGTPFKRALTSLTAGDIVQVVGPGGRLSLADDVARVAFLVGGVGITPVRSTLREARFRGRVFKDALVLFGNRDESCIPFRGEFEEMSDSGVRLVNVLEEPSPEWDGERGLITAELVARYLEPDEGREYFVTGPPGMVSAMERVLDELEITPRQRMVERFGSAT
jgi:ferredoxin-NADP reductase